MLQTLFYIPPGFFGVPGVILWLALCGVWLGAVAIRDKEKLKPEFLATLPIMIVGCIAIVFLLPQMAKPEINPADPLGEPIIRGLAIRGYGVMLMLGVLAGMGIVFYRCHKIGYPSEHIFRLAIWMIVCGMIGARLFFVIQKRDQFFPAGTDLVDVVKSIFNMVEGGLVVYGSMIGALIAAAYVVWKWKLPVWLTADLIAPGMALGLAIGRIGCLLNGCCWGGVCDVPLPAIEFPAGSAPYMQHINNGRLFGLETSLLSNEAATSGVETATEDPGPYQYRVLKPGDTGTKIGLTEGEKITVFSPEADRMRYIVGTSVADRLVLEVFGNRNGEATIPVSELRQTSLGVHPTQIYSSINALVLCLFLWFYWYFRRNDGEVMGLMLILYPISRFVLELIRNDESGQFGTDLTISQWVSMLTIVCGIGLFSWARMFGNRAPVPAPETQTLAETGSTRT